MTGQQCLQMKRPPAQLALVERDRLIPDQASHPLLRLRSLAGWLSFRWHESRQTA